MNVQTGTGDGKGERMNVGDVLLAKVKKRKKIPFLATFGQFPEIAPHTPKDVHTFTYVHLPPAPARGTALEDSGGTGTDTVRKQSKFKEKLIL